MIMLKGCQDLNQDISFWKTSCLVVLVVVVVVQKMFKSGERLLSRIFSNILLCPPPSQILIHCGSVQGKMLAFQNLVLHVLLGPIYIYYHICPHVAK